MALYVNKLLLAKIIHSFIFEVSCGEVKVV